MQMLLTLMYEGSSSSLRTSLGNIENDKAEVLSKAYDNLVHGIFQERKYFFLYMYKDFLNFDGLEIKQITDFQGFE